MSPRSGSPAASSRRSVRLVATAAVVGLASTAIVAAGGGTAAAADLPNAQAVGRFVDGSAGGNPIQSLADVADARATAPGTTSAQNPLDVKLFNALDIPLTNVVSIPTAPAVDAGAVNQVAQANLNGKSLGASGAVANDGGANVGNAGSGAPTSAKINLSDAALGTLPLPAVPTLPGLPGTGATSLPAIGGLTGSVQGVYSQVSTARGGEIDSIKSGVADVNLTLQSPALGALLNQINSVLGGASLSQIPGLSTLLGNLSLPSDCALSGKIPSDIPLGQSGITLKLTTDDGEPNAGIELSLATLIKSLLGENISDLDTSNFDLISFLVTNLPKILSKGLSTVITGITNTLADQFKKCVANLPAGLSDVLTQVTTALQGGQKQIVDAITGVADQFDAAGATGLTTLADGLKNLVDIGLNVQSGPGIEPRDSDYPYESNLEATPNQSTPVVEDQTLVRAIEINVLDATAIPSLPGTNSGKVTQLAGKAAANRPYALAPGDGVLNIALANAAAGPSNVSGSTVVPEASTPATAVPATNIPTGIPAGQAGGSHDDGLPVLPLVAILMLMMVSGGAFWQYRMRGLHQH